MAPGTGDWFCGRDGTRTGCMGCGVATRTDADRATAHGEAVSRDEAWALLRALASEAARGASARDGSAVRLDDAGCLRVVGAQDARIVTRPAHECGWERAAPLGPGSAELFDLYAPLCVGARASRCVIAHLGQSLDGRLSALPNAARFITGPEDVEHTHRLRALFDAVVVGAETAAVDDPRLTTRLVPGAQPVRVVFDPRARLDHGLRVLSDGAADTLVVTGVGHGARHRGLGSRVDVLETPLVDGRFALRAVLDALAARGLRRVFIEGGGVTVSHFLEAKLLDRLHLTIVPRNVGDGAPGVALRPTRDLATIPRVRSRRFALGQDVLFDCDLGRDGV